MATLRILEISFMVQFIPSSQNSLCPTPSVRTEGYYTTMGQEILPKSVKLYKTALCVGVKLGAIMINILMQFVIIITKWGVNS